MFSVADRYATPHFLVAFTAIKQIQPLFRKRLNLSGFRADAASISAVSVTEFRDRVKPLLRIPRLM